MAPGEDPERGAGPPAAVDVAGPGPPSVPSSAGHVAAASRGPIPPGGEMAMSETRPMPSPVAPPLVNAGEGGPRVRITIGRLDVQVHPARPGEPAHNRPPAPTAPPTRPARAVAPFAANALEQRGLERFGLAP